MHTFLHMTDDYFALTVLSYFPIKVAHKVTVNFFHVIITCIIFKNRSLIFM